MNYYEILEISENASEEVIRSAYKSLAKNITPISQKQIRTPKNAWQRSMPLMMSCLIRFPGGHTICACAPKKSGCASFLFVLIGIVLIVLLIRGCRGGRDTSARDRENRSSEIAEAAVKPTAGPNTATYPLSAEWDQKILELLDEAERPASLESRFQNYSAALNMRCAESLFKLLIDEKLSGNAVSLDMAVIRVKEDVMPVITAMTEVFSDDLVVDAFAHCLDDCENLWLDQIADLAGDIGTRLGGGSFGPDDYWEAYLSMNGGVQGLMDN